MKNKQEISKLNNKSNSRTQKDKNGSYQEETNLEKEKGYKKMKMKMKYVALKNSRDGHEEEGYDRPLKSKNKIVYYNDSQVNSSKKNYNNILNKNNIILKKLNFGKKLVPLKINANGKLKNLKNGQNEHVDENNEHDNYVEEFTPKFNGNNPLVKKGDITRKKLHMEIEENPLKSVANKICNIKIYRDKNENENKETIEFEIDDINENEYSEGEDKNENDKEQCEENGFDEIGYINNEEEEEELEEEKDEEQEEFNEGEKNNDKDIEEDEIVNYDNRNNYENKKFNKIKKKENIINEQNNEKIIKQDTNNNKEKPNINITQKQEKNIIRMQKAQSFLQPCIPQKLKKMNKTQEIQLNEITKNNLDSESYGEKEEEIKEKREEGYKKGIFSKKIDYSNKNKNNSIPKDTENKKEKYNILAIKNNILNQEKKDQNNSQNKIFPIINDKNKIGKNNINISSSNINNSNIDKKNNIKIKQKNINIYTGNTKDKSYKESVYISSRNKSLNSSKNHSLNLILPEKSSNARNKTNEIHFLSSVTTPNNKLKSISSQKLLKYNNQEALINKNNLIKIEKSDIYELGENREITEDIKRKIVNGTPSNNINKNQDLKKKNANSQHIIMISSKRNYSSKDKDENMDKNINRTYNNIITNKYNNRYNNNNSEIKNNQGEIENSGITHSIKYTNKKTKTESNNNNKPHSIIIIKSTKEGNKNPGRSFITSSSILSPSLGYNDRYNKNNLNKNLGNEYKPSSKPLNNNNQEEKNKNNIDNNFNTNKSLNLNKAYKIEINNIRNPSRNKNNVHTIYISPSSKTNKENKKEIKQKEIKHTNEIYYSSYFSHNKNYSKNENSLCKSISSLNTSSVKSDIKINKPIKHNTLIIKSKRGEGKDKTDADENNSFKLNLNNITISSNTSKRTDKSKEKNEVKDESSLNIPNMQNNCKNKYAYNSAKNNKNEKNNDDIKSNEKEDKILDVNEINIKEENVNNSTITSSKNKSTENNKDIMITNSEFNVNEKKDEITEIEANPETQKKDKNPEVQKEDKPEMDLNNINSDKLTSIQIENKTENLSSNDTKQEKIENKFDFLNFGSSFNINTITDNNKNNNNEDIKDKSDKIKEESIFDKYPFLSSPELYDFAKEYLNLYNSTTRHELSDYTKEYLNSLGTNTSTSNTRPELSNLTKAYLLENTIGFEDLENKGS